MVTGPMIFGAANDAKSDSTSLQAAPPPSVPGNFGITLQVYNYGATSVAVSGASSGGGKSTGDPTQPTGVRSAGVVGAADGPYSDGVIGIASGFAPGSIPRPNAGVFGLGRVHNADGVYGLSDTSGGAGVRGHGFGNNGIGVVGAAHNGSFPLGVLGYSRTGQAGRFLGDVEIIGKLFKSVAAFRIDHPLDPVNKYLQHAAVESPEMMNIYAGNVKTGTNGTAVVELPTYCQELNGDFCYQLTVVGGFAQAVISEEIRDNRFSIATDRPEVTVSWQVTGVRRDAWAEQNRLVVEQDKPEHERGKFLHPELYGEPVSQSVDYEFIVQNTGQEVSPPDAPNSQ
jgi:hypothetical protein